MKDKKAILLAIITVIGFMGLTIGNKTIVAYEELDLSKFASVMEDENIIISEWSLHAREKMESFETLDQAEGYTNQLKKAYADWEWTVKSESDQWEATASKTDDEGIAESIKMMSAEAGGEIQSYLTYEMKGSLWNSDTEQLAENKLKSRLSDLFRGNTTIFSCMKGEFNDKINGSLSNTASHLLEVFDAEEIETLEEENFVSTTASSPMFHESVAAGGQKMNVQIGLRTEGMGANTTIVIGTPIITIEY
ncbi:YwmB family TATA-box binding protein [Cytobacillus gottheilii]|uniref:YwmB family TATA-box binding protein n=1 Tax=Cytobacillus gottheilii TaxID=859144 RepID=A0ABX8FAE1_9BACI|nr:YwmB family TATA-box binding protein [Cytobacillus gottheilii]QVY61363.1 YwmB family TATA-box binding protein [Cytobacillus gottheilii]